MLDHVAFRAGSTKVIRGVVALLADGNNVINVRLFSRNPFLAVIAAYAFLRPDVPDKNVSGSVSEAPFPSRPSELVVL